MKKRLSDILKGKVVIVGIGNVLRGDDGFGPALIEKLQGSVDVCLIDAGTAPESYAGKLIKEKPDVILLVDAVHLGLPAGGWDLLEESEIMKSGLTTHDLSPRLLIEYVKRETNAAIYLLGVEPKNVSLGEEMSEPVRKALDEISELIKESNHARNPSD